MQDPRLQDFRTFLHLIWARLNLPEPTPVQLDIAKFLQSSYGRICIEAFRGVGKSWITAAYVAYCLYWHPEWNVLVISASGKKAKQFTTFVAQLIELVPELQHMQPRADQRSSKIEFDVRDAPPSQSPSLLSLGITSTFTGARADLIIADDVEVPNNSYSDEARAKLAEAIKEFADVIKPEPHARIVFLGTPQTEESIYNSLPSKGYTVRIWPARVPDEEVAKGYDELAPMVEEMMAVLPAGAPTDPQRFDHDELLLREAEKGRSSFALQFMLDTSLSDRERYPLRLTDLVVMGLDWFEGPEKIAWASGPDQKIKDLECVGFKGDCYHRPLALEKHTTAKYEAAVMAIDPSGKGADETAFAVVKKLYSRLFVTAAGGVPGGYSEETLDTLLKIARAQEVKTIRVEENFGGGMFAQMLRTRMAVLGYHCEIEEVRASTQKERRIIDTLEPIMNQHRLVVSRSVIEHDHQSVRSLPPEQALRKQLFYQMSRITKERGALAHDDRLDALAWAVDYFTEQLGTDPNNEQQAAHDRMILEQIQKEWEHYGVPMVNRKRGPRTTGRILRPRRR